jgi:hypothetical protein
VLVDRTKSEVAGTLLTAQLALQHGLACNTAGGYQEGDATAVVTAAVTDEIV